MQCTLKALVWCSTLSLAVAQAAAAQAAQVAQPGPEHERLGYFVGKWTTEGETKAGPMGSGGKFTSTDTCEWFEGRYSVVCRSEGNTPAGASRSIGILGYSPEEKVYTYYGVNNTPMGMPSVPKGTRKGGTWTYTDEGTMGGKKYKSRVTLEEISPTSYTFRMEIQGANGKWLPVSESRSTR